MSDPKEPLFWATDFPGAQAQVPVRLNSINDYLKLFEQRTSKHSIVGEATARYLSSTVAVRQILNFNPKSRFLVLLRNPIDFVTSYHSEMLYSMTENVENFETAWNLQEARLEGRHIPSSCCQMEFLQYRTVAKFGAQVARLKELVGLDQYQIILLNDFMAEPRATYIKILEFLGLPDDGRTSFPRVNARKAPRFRLLNSLYYTNNRFLRRVVHGARRRAKRVQSLRNLWTNLKSKPKGRTKISDTMHGELVETFAEDVQLLSGLLGRNLDHWLEPRTDSA